MQGTTVPVVVSLELGTTVLKAAAAMVIILHHTEDMDHLRLNHTGNLTVLLLQNMVKAILHRSSTMATDRPLRTTATDRLLHTMAMASLLSSKTTDNLHSTRVTRSHSDRTPRQVVLPKRTSIHTAIPNRTTTPTPTTAITQHMRRRKAHSSLATAPLRTIPSSTVTVPASARPC